MCGQKMRPTKRIAKMTQKKGTVITSVPFSNLIPL